MKLKVLIFIDTLGAGGAEQVLVNLVPHLMMRGLEVEVVSLFGSNVLRAELEEKGVKVHELKLSHRWNLFEAIFKLRKLLHEKSYDILHGNLYFGGLYAFGAKLWFPKARVLQTLHGFEFDRDLASSIFKKLRRRIRLYVLSSSDALIAVTPSVSAHYRIYLPKTKIFIIANPVVTEFNDAITSVHAKEGFRISVPARLIPEKGHEILLHALHVISKQHSDFRCEFYGEGPLRDTLLKKVEELKLEKFVLLRGRIKHSELLGEIAFSDLIILPSLSEGFGMAAAEAMGLGKIVIASNTGGLSNLIDNENNGFLVEPGDSHALALAIENVMHGKFNLPQIRAQALKTIQEKYSVQVVADQWFSVYQGNFL